MNNQSSSLGKKIPCTSKQPSGNSSCTPGHSLLPSGNSPCIGICKYNKADYCLGCKRNSDEISNWMSYSDAMRNAIMKDLESREIDGS
jgi:predicted Fe-S protein YdhL (DUF1289 family)